MKKRTSLLGLILLVAVFWSCSNTEEMVRNTSETELSAEMLRFKDAMIVWTKATHKAKENKDLNVNSNDLIVNEATDLLLANGYTEDEVRKQLVANENIVIANAIRLYAQKTQVKH